MPDAKQWARAFAQQAQADHRTYVILCQQPELPICQQLHMLQMACEKLCKASMFLIGDDPDHIQSTHAIIRKVLPRIFAEEFTRGKYRERNEQKRLMSAVNNLAREIDLLAPAVHMNAGLARPDNCEYPWDDGFGSPIAPANHEYPNLSLLKDPIGRTLLKVISLAIDRYATES